MTSLTPLTDRTRAVLADMPPPETTSERIQSAVRDALALAIAREADNGATPQELAEGARAAATMILVTACTGSGTQERAMDRLDDITTVAGVIIKTRDGIVNIVTIKQPGRVS